MNQAQAALEDGRKAKQAARDDWKEEVQDQ